MAFVDAAKGCANGALLVGRGGESREYGTSAGLDGGDESTGPKAGDDDGVTFTDEGKDQDTRYIGVGNEHKVV